MNIYDTANQLERELRSLPEYTALKEEIIKVKADSKAAELFEEFKKMQKNLEQKMLKGEMPTSEEQTKMQEVAEKIDKNEVLSTMLQKERAFSMIVEDVMKLIQAPVQEIYK
ncbi:MAG: YlbF family regulator [Lactobacillales bacterium]|nr:YlbF family regulator [Lactobacillales bacterium]